MFGGTKSLKHSFARRGVFATPDPRKAHGTEDAFFATDSALAVADGVGGWGSKGVNAGIFARAVMAGALELVKQQPEDSNVSALTLLNAGYQHVLSQKIQGSCPVVACSLINGGKNLSINNLGDCAIMVLRNGKVMYRSNEGQHYFNCPFQLSSNSGRDTPSKGELGEVGVKDGDVVILASDGVFDNIEDEVAIDIVGRHTKASAEWKCATIAEEIGHEAVKASKLTSGLLPFGRRSVEQTGKRFEGGKVDDVTVLVARVCDSNHPIKELCPETMDEVIPVKPMAKKGWF